MEKRDLVRECELDATEVDQFLERQRELLSRWESLSRESKAALLTDGVSEFDKQIAKRRALRKRLEASRDELPASARLIGAVRCSIQELREARYRLATHASQ